MRWTLRWDAVSSHREIVAAISHRLTEQDRLGRWRSGIADRGVASDPPRLRARIVRRIVLVCVCQIHVTVGREVRIDGDAEQTVVPVVIDAVAKIDEWSRQQGSILHDLDRAVFE